MLQIDLSRLQNFNIRLLSDDLKMALKRSVPILNDDHAECFSHSFIVFFFFILSSNYLKLYVDQKPLNILFVGM